MTASCSTCTYYFGVLQKEIWCPMNSEVRYYNAINMPTKAVLLEEVGRLAALHGLNMGFDAKHQPDKEFLVVILGTITNGDHWVFRPKPEPMHKKITELTADSAFFADLPVSKSKKMSGGVARHLLCRKTLARARMGELKQKQLQLKMQIVAQKKMLEQLGANRS